MHEKIHPMRIRRSAIIWSVGFLLWAGLVASLPAFIRLQSDYCYFDIMGEFPSPNGEQVALVIRESCGGATMPFLTSVAIKEVGRVAAIKEAGKVFPFEELESTDYLFRVQSQIGMEVIWNDDRSLTIVYDRPYRIYRQLYAWRTMPISYRERQ
jgi:hypothetical protein